MSNFEKRLQEAIEERKNQQKTISGSIERFKAYCSRHGLKASNITSIIIYQNVCGVKNG